MIQDGFAHAVADLKDLVFGSKTADARGDIPVLGAQRQILTLPRQDSIVTKPSLKFAAHRHTRILNRSEDYSTQKAQEPEGRR